MLGKALDTVTPETPLFWSTWGRRSGGKTRAPMTGQNVWRLCKVYGRRIGYPMLKPHDLRHGVALEVLEQHHDLEEVRALLGHSRIDTTQIYTTIRPPHVSRTRTRNTQQKQFGGPKGLRSPAHSRSACRWPEGWN